MNIFHPVYICEDYTVSNNVLVVEKPVLLAMVKTIEQFNSLIESEQYNAVVCPDLMPDHRFEYVKFI